MTGVYADEAMAGQPVMEIEYDDRGFRVAKTSYDTAHNPAWKTWYVRDGSGTVLSIYAENLATGSGPIQYEIPVYGANRIGMYRPLEQTTYYEIKDHLGNVRAVIGSTDSVRYTATMESELSAYEEEYFEITRRISTADYINHTPDTLSAGIANEVIRINNARDSVLNIVGAGIMLKVYPGDTIRSMAFAKYADFDNSNTNLVPGLAGYLGSVFGLPVVGESGLPIFDVVEQPWFLGLEAWNDLDEDQPRAYLNFLLFDNNFSFQDFGFDQVSTAAKITGDPLTHQHEELNLEVIVKKEGFIYLYITNENDQDMEVYFDDFIVDHVYGDIVAGGDYYPFGLPLAGRTIQKKGYRHDYQGEFAEKDEETGWDAFELRMYDPVIGRWISVDPARQFASPYVGMGNNPIIFYDPTGGCVDGEGNTIPCPGGISEAGNENTVILDGIIVTPEPFTLEVEGQHYTFGKGNTKFQRMGLRAMNTPDNSIANYAYYLKHKEKFKGAAFGEIFVSDEQRREYFAEDALLEAAEALTGGSFDSGNTKNHLGKSRRSRYANLFPSNKKEFTPTLQQRREYRLYKIEKNMSAVHRSPEFSSLERKYENTMLLFD